MKKSCLYFAIVLLAAFGLSCTKTLQRRYDERHGTTSASSRYDAADRTSPTSTGRDAYKRDYEKMMEEDNKSGYAKTDYNQKLVTQYEEMDKVGELVLYEIDILESRWNTLIGEYRSANSSGKEVISAELDKITDDRLVLYKAYTNIYKNGKTNWVNVKREVENTLRLVRRIDNNR